MSDASTLIEKISSRKAQIAIIGLGYVGLPLALRFSQVGFKTIGLDIDLKKIDLIRQGESFINHIAAQDIQTANNNGFEVSSDFARAKEADAIILCVPTPLNVYREPDLSYVFGTMESLLPHLRKGQVVSLESTTYPGTTEEELKPRIESQGFEVGKDIFLVYSPEREDPGNKTYSTQSIPKVCGGTTPGCLEIGVALYESVVDEVVPVSSTQTAEMTKILENIHRAVNIGLVNELKIVADKMDIDIFEVIKAAATKPFGFVPYYPGPGLGGHCIPIDPFYLTWKAREYGKHTRFIELAGEINASMPDYVIRKVISALNKEGKAVNGSRILLLGLAYKANVDDCRESPSFVLIENMESYGATVDYNDPNVPVIPETREHAVFAGRCSVAISDDYDLILLVTDHVEYHNYDFSTFSVPLVDTRDCINKRPSKYLRA